MRAVGQIRDLHRGGLAGEDQQAVVRHVHGEIDENVDPVLADHLGEPLVRQAHVRPPYVGGSPATLGDRVGNVLRGVAEDLEMPMIVRFQQRQQKSPDGVQAEIGRDVADAQAAVGRTVVGVGPDRLRQRRGVLAVPAEVFVQIVRAS